MWQRKIASKVRNGKVRGGNRAALSPDYYVAPLDGFVIDRKKPGRGYTHLLTRRDVGRFLSILPDWGELSQGLNAIVLAPGEPGVLGWHTAGVVAVCAWERDLWVYWEPGFHQEHQDILRRLRVESVKCGGQFMCRFTRETAVAFQLLHILLHELGHHHDRMTTREQKEAARGEPFAEAYARAYEDRIFQAYLREFGI